ncbi:MAG: Crp/Fnr family transcriptional regulator [Clostridiales bacterium]
MIDELLKNYLFCKIDVHDIEKHIIEKNIYIKHYSKGTTVYNQKDKCKTLDIVVSGKLAACSLSENGSETAVFEFIKQNIIGANLLFGESQNYPFNIYCIYESKIIHITTKAILEFLHEYNFVMGFIKSISKNSQSMNRKISIFTQKTLRENIMDYFKQLSILQNSNLITIPMTKKQLADYFGVQRPSLFRELKKLKDEQIIDIKNKEITITGKE